MKPLESALFLRHYYSGLTAKCTVLMLKGFTSLIITLTVFIESLSIIVVLQARIDHSDPDAECRL